MAPYIKGLNREVREGFVYVSEEKEGSVSQGVQPGDQILMAVP